jgi:hypothetical protein
VAQDNGCVTLAGHGARQGYLRRILPLFMLKSPKNVREVTGHAAWGQRGGIWLKSLIAAHEPRIVIERLIAPMTREEFSTVVSTALEDAIQFAEEEAGRKLPRTFAFQWLGRTNPRLTENIIEEIVKRVFIDEGHIYPCVDMGVADLLHDGSLLIIGSVAGYAPRPFGPNWTGRQGPFVPIVGISFLNKLVGAKDSFSPDKPFRFITLNLAKARSPWHVKPQIPKLPDKLREDLNAITPSRDSDIAYWPCAARMKDGAALVCVYVVPEGPYIKHWGIYPQQDRGKSYISIADVEALAESPRRLPARFANKLYRSGESGMGYTIFTVVFGDGSRQAYGCGNAVDFIRYPDGKGPGDVVDVLPHEGRNAEPASCPDHWWCLFSE